MFLSMRVLLGEINLTTVFVVPTADRPQAFSSNQNMFCGNLITEKKIRTGVYPSSQA